MSDEAGRYIAIRRTDVPACQAAGWDLSVLAEKILARGSTALVWTQARTSERLAVYDTKTGELVDP